MKRTPKDGAVALAGISLRNRKRENDVAKAEYRRRIRDAPTGSHDADLVVLTEVKPDGRGPRSMRTRDGSGTGGMCD